MQTRPAPKAQELFVICNVTKVYSNLKLKCIPFQKKTVFNSTISSAYISIFNKCIERRRRKENFCLNSSVRTLFDDFSNYL